MMPAPGPRRFAYAQARLQARLGMLPSPEEWSELEQAASLGGLLHHLRGTLLPSWAGGIGPGSDVHIIEGLLRQRLRARIAETAGWPGPDWQAAVAWTVHLPDLPALFQLAHDPEFPAWLREDPLLRPFAHDDRRARHALLKASPYAYLLDAESPQAVAAAWSAGWRQRWPSTTRGERRALEALIALLGSARDQLAGPAVETAAVRAGLTARLAATVRREAQSPAALFAYLALVALHLLRLRGLLVRLALFGREEAA